MHARFMKVIRLRVGCPCPNEPERQRGHAANLVPSASCPECYFPDFDPLPAEGPPAPASSSGTKIRLTELMQYRSPVG